MKHITILSLLFIAMVSCNSSTSSISLKADVKKSDTQLVISNNDSFSWKAVKIVLNKDYNFTVDQVDPGQTIEIGFMNFTDAAYKKFNPFVYQASDVQIYCNNAQGNECFASATFRK